MEMNFQVLNHSNESALSSPVATSSYFLTIHLLWCSALIYFFLASYHYSQLFWQFIKVNFMKQFQDSFKRKKKNPFLCACAKNANLQKFSLWPNKRSLNSLLKYVKLLDNEISASAWHTKMHMLTSVQFQKSKYPYYLIILRKVQLSSKSFWNYTSTDRKEWTKVIIFFFAMPQKIRNPSPPLFIPKLLW